MDIFPLILIGCVFGAVIVGFVTLQVTLKRQGRW